MSELLAIVVIAACAYMVGSMKGSEDTQHAIWTDCMNEQKFVIREATFNCHVVPGSGGGKHLEFSK